jgi:hypothetical protein
MARLQLIREQIKAIEEARLEQLKQGVAPGTHHMLLMLAQITGIGVVCLTRGAHTSSPPAVSTCSA